MPAGPGKKSVAPVVFAGVVLEGVLHAAFLSLNVAIEISPLSPVFFARMIILMISSGQLLVVVSIAFAAMRAILSYLLH